MVTTFKTSSTNVLTAQPNAAGEKLILRSTNSGDTMNVVITGTVSGSPDSETIALTGKREVQTTKTYTAVASITLASAATGIVTIYGQGVAGRGDIRVDTVPATGTTMTLGLTGFTQVYTFRSPARLTITTLAFASISQADYLDVTAASGAIHRFWFDKDAAGTGAPSNPGTLSKVSIVTGNTADQVATALNAKFVTDLSDFATSVSTSTITLTGGSLGTGSLTDGTGGHDTGFTLTSIQAGTADAANQIRTSYNGDGTAITTSQVAQNIYDAVGATNVYGDDGTTWGSGTTENAYVTPTVLTSVVTLTDKLAIGRLLTWANSQSSTHLTMRSITGATTSLAQATFRNTVTQLLTAAITLNTEDRTTATLPAGVTPTCDWVLVGGKKFTIALSTEQTSDDIVFKYQTSQDRVTARDGDTSLSGFSSSNGIASYRNKLYNPAENAEYVRLVVTSNPNTLDTAVNAKLIA